MALPETQDDQKSPAPKSQQKKEDEQQQLPAPTPAATTNETVIKKGTGDDKDFDPSVEALINDIDDERTLEEEEAHGDNNQARVQEELDDLKKESEMPIEELLAYYERMRQQEGAGNDDDEEEDEEEDEDFDEDDDDEEEDDEDDDGDEPKKRVTSSKDNDNDQGGNGSNTGSGGTKRSSSDGPPPSTKKSVDEHGQPQSKQTDQTSNSSKEHRITNIDTNQIIEATSTIPTSTTLDGQQTTTRTITAIENTRLNNRDLPTDDCEQIHDKDDQTKLSPDNSISIVGEPHLNDSLTRYLLQQSPSSAFQKLLGYDLEDSDDDDYSYTSDERSDDERDWRRSIHVGPEYQADIPEGLSEYDSLPPYQTNDTLVWLWDDNLTHENLIDYLKKSSQIQRRKDVCITPASVPRITPDSLRQWKHLMATTSEQNPDVASNQSTNNFTDVYMNQSRKRNEIDQEIERENIIEDSLHDSVNEGTSSDSASQDNNKPELSTEHYFQDEEQLLYLLLQCNFDTEEALRRRTLDPFKYYFHEPMSLWSENECLAFENGLRMYGKDFRQIRENKVPTRTHAELVAFYYLWKKSERHDVYTNRYKLDRKRSLTHPGTTDYMDNFIDDTLKLNSSASPSSPATINSNDMNVNVELCNDSGLATPSCMLSDSRSPQSNTPNQSQVSSNTQKSLLQIHHGSVENEEPSHRETVYLDSNIHL